MVLNVKVKGRALIGSKERAMMGMQSLEFVCDDGVCGPTQQLGSKKQRDNPGPLSTQLSLGFHRVRLCSRHGGVH